MSKKTIVSLEKVLKQRILTNSEIFFRKKTSILYKRFPFFSPQIECQCISTVAFSRSEQDLLDNPVWVMLINVVALEMLRAKMPEDANGVVVTEGSRKGGLKGKANVPGKLKIRC